MSNKAIVLIALLAGLIAGFVLSRISLDPEASAVDEVAANETAAGEQEILYWVAPMDSNYRRDGPGKSPMGMDLVPVYATEADDGVAISPEVVQSLGVQTEPVERGRLWRRVNATGHVDLDERLTSHIHLRYSGWLSNLRVSAEGDRVRAGQTLFTVYSPELVNAQKEFLQALRRGDQGLIAAASEKLDGLGVPNSQIAVLRETRSVINHMPVLAPQDGVITHLDVRDHMFVSPGDTVMALADLSRVWIHARVFESQVHWITEGQPTEVRLDYLPGQVFEGAVDYVYPILDPTTRTAHVRLGFENPDRLLKPNMFVNVAIFAGPKENTLSVPRDALIRSGDQYRLAVAIGKGRFEVREVVAGIESGGFVEILRGVEAGENVVTSGQFLIDSEASLSGSVRRLSSRSLRSHEHD